MITQLIWTIWTPMSSVPKKADKLNLSLSVMTSSANQNKFMCIFGGYTLYHSHCYLVFSCDQAALQMVQSVRLSVRPSVRPSHLFDYVPIIVSSWNFQELLPMTKVMSMQKVKVRGQRSRSQRSQLNLTVSGLWLQFEFTYDDEMIHIAWCCLGEVSYCFSRSSVKFQGHTALIIIEFDPDWAFPDSNSSLNSPMAMKCFTKPEVA